MTGVDILIRAKRFPDPAGGEARVIYRDFSFVVAPLSVVVLLAPSGLGKTTLLNMIAGLDRDYDGRIGFGTAGAPRIAYAFQSPRLLPWRTVVENVALPLGEDAAALAAARAMLEEVGLAEQAQAYPERLSLGQQRRVALARAFALEPDLLLMDEPFVSLDEAGAARLRDLLRRLLARRPATVIFVTHDSREAVELGSRIVRLDGPPARILRDVAIDLDLAARRGAAGEALRAELMAP